MQGMGRTCEAKFHKRSSLQEIMIVTDKLLLLIWPLFENSKPCYGIISHNHGTPEQRLPQCPSSTPLNLPLFNSDQVTKHFPSLPFPNPKTRSSLSHHSSNRALLNLEEPTDNPMAWRDRSMLLSIADTTVFTIREETSSLTSSAEEVFEMVCHILKLPFRLMMQILMLCSCDLEIWLL